MLYLAWLLLACLLGAGSSLESGEDGGCPTGCSCSVNGITQVVAMCSTFNNKQRFDDSTGKLMIENAAGLVLTDNIFHTVGVSDVHTISISSSVFQKIEPRAFDNLDQLSSLELEGNNGMVLTADIFKNTSAIRMSVRQSKLMFSDHQRYLFDIPTLSELELVNSDVAPLLNPETFSKMPLLQSINLASNLIRRLEPMFSGLEDLEELNLSDNMISEIQPDLFENSSLDILNLHKNPISSIKGVRIPMLTDIDLSLCKFSVLDADMFKEVPKLARVNLSGNAITEIDVNAFYYLDDLIHLDLSNNALRGPLPGRLFLANRGLQVLSLAHNPSLRSLPADLFEDKEYIFKLDLSYCGLASLHPALFKDLTALITLNLAGNALQEIEPNTLRSSIVYLDLSHNNITDLSLVDFSRELKVQTLSLAFNKLGEVSTNHLKNLEYLRSLNLRSCGLRSLWTEFKGVRSAVLRGLIQLDLSKNSIQKIIPRQLQLTPRLRMLDISENKLVCDANFRSSLKWLEEHKVEHMSLFEARREQSDIVRPGHPYGNDGLSYPNPLDNGATGEVINPPHSWNLIESVVCEESLKEEMKADDYNEDDDQDDADSEDDEDEDEEDDDDEDGDYASPKTGVERDIVIKQVSVLQADDIWTIVIVTISGVAIMLSLSALSCFILRWHRQRNSFGAAMIKHMNTPKLKRDRSSIYQQLHEELNSPTTPVMSIKLGKNDYSKIAPQSV